MTLQSILLLLMMLLLAFGGDDFIGGLRFWGEAARIAASISKLANSSSSSHISLILNLFIGNIGVGADDAFCGGVRFWGEAAMMAASMSKLASSVSESSILKSLIIIPR